jgi:hypothetical protein
VRSTAALEVEIDLEAAFVTVSRDGVTVGRMPWPIDSGEAGSAVVRLNYEFGGRAVTFTTRHGDSITAEFPDQNDFAPVNQRPIIYLDQNHWSALAKALHEPEAVREPVRVAAERLASLARKRAVILPLSLGHMGETGQWGNDARRYRLALTMLELSAGWQLRDVLLLRRAELKRALASDLGHPMTAGLPAVTLEPGAITARAQKYQPPSDFDAELSFAAEALVEFSVIFDVMLQDVAIGLESVPGWADRLQRVTRQLADEKPDAKRRRAVSLETFLHDLPHELAVAAYELGVSAEDAADWLMASTEETIASMPSLGIFRELLHEKLADPGTVWEQNDLTDMMYLSCGAAYADHVVGERRLIGDLRSSLARLRRPSNIHSKLADLVPVLDDGLELPNSG